MLTKNLPHHNSKHIDIAVRIKFRHTQHVIVVYATYTNEESIYTVIVKSTTFLYL